MAHTDPPLLPTLLFHTSYHSISFCTSFEHLLFEDVFAQPLSNPLSRVTKRTHLIHKPIGL
jgi:hypothetical protein